MVRLTVEWETSFWSAPLLILAGAPLRRHHAPLIVDLGDFLLRDAVEEGVGTEDAFDPGELPCCLRFARLAANALAHVEFGLLPERHRLAAAFDLGIDLSDSLLILLLGQLERGSAANFALLGVAS
jgi:hypothetical protein